VSTINPTSNIIISNNGNSRGNELSPRSPKKSINSSDERKSQTSNSPTGKIVPYSPTMPMIAEGNS